MPAFNSIERGGELVQQMLRLLDGAEAGLPLWEIVDRLDHRALTISEKYQSDFTEALRHSCIGPLAAGWFTVKFGNHFFITDAGRTAVQRYPEPRQLMLAASRSSRKARVSLHFPSAYRFAIRTKDRLQAERTAVRRIGAGRVARKLLGHRDEWEKVLPVQRPRQVPIDGFDAKQLLAILTREQVPYSEGGHAIYLTPEALLRSPFRCVASDYPPGTGLKIAKNLGGVEGGRYINHVGKGDSRIHLRLVHGHGALALVANLLAAEDLGPRLVDLLELRCGSDVLTAFAIEHVSGGEPTIEVCEAGVARLRELEAGGAMRTVLPEGFDDEEFACPNCRNNALTDDQGRFRYIDFQNFMLTDYGKYLHSALRAAGAHEGIAALPGMSRRGSAAFASQTASLAELLEEAGVSVRGRLVVCDPGTGLHQVAQLLALGAYWCHLALDQDSIPAWSRALMALGCSRFSFAAEAHGESPATVSSLPTFLKSTDSRRAVHFTNRACLQHRLASMAASAQSCVLVADVDGATPEGIEAILRQSPVPVRVAAIRQIGHGVGSGGRVAVILTA